MVIRDQAGRLTWVQEALVILGPAAAVTLGRVVPHTMAPVGHVIVDLAVQHIPARAVVQAHSFACVNY